MAKRRYASARINKIMKRDKREFLVVGLLIVICLTAFNVIFSDMYVYSGSNASPVSMCPSCTSEQYVYYPSTEGFSLTVPKGYTFTKSFLLEDYINYADMSRYYESYYFFVLDKNTYKVLYSSGTKHFPPRMSGGSVDVSESFSVVINESTVLQLQVIGIPFGAYGIGTEMQYNIGHRPTWVFFVDNVVPTGYTCGGQFGCPIGYYCSNGLCMLTQNVNSNPNAILCLGSYSCPVGYDCLNGICQTTTTPVQPTIPTGTSGSTSPPATIPVTPTTPTTPAVPTTPTVPVNDTNASTTTPSVHPWTTQGSYDGLQVIAGLYPTIIYPDKTLLANTNYQFKTPATLYFEGAGPDEPQTSHIVTDPNYTNPLNPWWRGVAEETNLATVGYAWDIDSDGTADYTTKSFTHDFTTLGTESTHIYQVMFRVKLRDVTTNEYFWSSAVQMNIKVYNEGAYSIWDVPCNEYGSNLSPLLQPLAITYCSFVKTVTVIVTLPIILVTNVYSALVETLCVGSYEGFWLNTIPLIVLLGFLLLMLIPDNIIEFAGATVLAYILGTTAPVLSATAVPLLVSLGTVAIPAGIATTGILSSTALGSGAIIMAFGALALFQVLYGEGSMLHTATKVVSKSFAGGGKSGYGAHSNISYVDVKVAPHTQGMDRARTVFADATLFVLLATYAECKLGLPIYSGVINFLMMVPQWLGQIAQALGGAI